MDDFDRLPRMSPVEDPIVPPAEGPGRRPARRFIRPALIVSGIALILGCGWYLVVGVTQMMMLIDPALEGPAYVLQVSRLLSDPRFQGLMIGPPSLGFSLGFVLLGLGFARRKKPKG
jgi:hypothetical protein